MPWVFPIVFGVLIAWSFVLGRTRFGRYIYAIGGSAEGARRAGIDLSLVRTLAFVLAGMTAGLGGVIYASRLNSISTSFDGGTIVLYVVATAVIGGASLFGGRGIPLHAVLGGVVIAGIVNGMALLGLARRRAADCDGPGAARRDHRRRRRTPQRRDRALRKRVTGSGG